MTARRTALVSSVSVAGPPGAEALARFVRPTALCSRRISSIADRLLELAACPVLVVK